MFWIVSCAAFALCTVIAVEFLALPSLQLRAYVANHIANTSFSAPPDFCKTLLKHFTSFDTPRHPGCSITAYGSPGQCMLTAARVSYGLDAAVKMTRHTVHDRPFLPISAESCGFRVCTNSLLCVLFSLKQVCHACNKREPSKECTLLSSCRQGHSGDILADADLDLGKWNVQFSNGRGYGNIFSSLT